MALRRSALRALLFVGAMTIALPAFAEDFFLYFPTYETVYRHFRVTVSSVTREDALKFPDRTEAPAPLGPGIWLVTHVDFALFRNGKRARIEGFEPMVEDADPSRLLARLSEMSQVHDLGIFLPGVPFEFDARPGEKLIFMTMFLQSNDLFYAPAKSGLVLYDFDGRPLEGDVTGRIRLWDAGTEINQPPGRGDFQAVRQKKLDYGTTERGVVRPVADGFTYPKTAEVIDVSILAGPPVVQRRGFYPPVLIAPRRPEIAPAPDAAPEPVRPHYVTIGGSGAM
jgi:hypothetical protein